MHGLIWVLSFTVLGPTPEYGEIPKFNTKQECLLALEQKREEYKIKKQRIVGSCSQTTKK